MWGASHVFQFVLDFAAATEAWIDELVLAEGVEGLLVIREVVELRGRLWKWAESEPLEILKDGTVVVIADASVVDVFEAEQALAIV